MISKLILSCEFVWYLKNIICSEPTEDIPTIPPNFWNRLYLKKLSKLLCHQKCFFLVLQVMILQWEISKHTQNKKPRLEL